MELKLSFNIEINWFEVIPYVKKLNFVIKIWNIRMSDNNFY